MSLAWLRPRTAGEILDGAFVLYRRHFGLIAVVSLLPQLPAVLLWMGVAASHHFGFPPPLGAGLESVAGYSDLYGFASLTFAQAALIHVAVQAVGGKDPALGAAYSLALRRFLPALAVTLLSLAGMLVGALALVVPGIAFFILASLATQVVVIEGAGAREAIRRSFALARPEWRRVGGVMVVCVAAYTIPTLLVQEAAAAASGEDPRIVAAGTSLSWLLQAFLDPIFAFSATLLYFDCRVRTEALDLEIAAEALPAPA